MLITGGSRGIGHEIVSIFQKNGFKVLSPSRQEMDLSSNDSISDYCNRIDGDIDVIINNAGLNAIATLDKLQDDILEQMLQINLKAPLKIIQCLEERIGKRGLGRIVNVSSIWSVVSKEGRCGYSATKSAINSFTRTLALEFSHKNILINSVAPGFVNTDLTRQNNTEEEIKNIEKTIPVGRMAEPAEIANLIFFLASGQNTYITGQTILIDGGYTCR